MLVVVVGGAESPADLCAGPTRLGARGLTAYAAGRMRRGAGMDEPRRLKLPFGRVLRWWPALDAGAGPRPTAP